MLGLNSYVLQRQQKLLDTIQTWFYDYGWPDYIRSDQGPQFRQEFDKFCADNSINHDLSSPYNPESNGLAESAVKIMKTLVISCKMQKESLTKAIAAWRNMTREDGTSPSQLFFGRRQRQVLPMMTDKLLPALQDTTNRDKLSADKTRRRNLHTRSYDSFNIGDKMWLQHHDTKDWSTQAVILAPRAGGSYYIQTDSGVFCDLCIKLPLLTPEKNNPDV